MQHAVTFYIKRGFDRKATEYFASGRRRATSVKPLSNKSIHVTFDRGEARFYDMGSMIRPGTAFAFLADEAAFERAYIDENNDIAWDIDPVKLTARSFGATRWTSARIPVTWRVGRLRAEHPCWPAEVVDFVQSVVKEKPLSVLTSEGG